MDISLDDYISTSKPSTRPAAQRLGTKKSPIIKNKTKKVFKVTGLGKARTFDARQKIKTKPFKQQDARLKLTQRKNFTSHKITAPGANDARLKLKSKMLDARSRIENKKGATAQDLRLKVNVLQGKQTDARAKINLKRKQTPQITVTGLGNVNTNFQGGASQRSKFSKSARNEQIQLNRVRLSGDSLVITKSNGPETTDESSLPGNAPTPKIRIKNDYYKPPDTAKKIPVRTTNRSPSDQGIFSRAVADTLVQQKQVRKPDPVYIQNPVYEAPIAPQPTVVQYQYVPVVEAPYTYVQEPAPQRHAYINPEFKKVSSRLGQKVSPTKQSGSDSSAYRVMIANLHTVVSQDDIVELFGAVGPLKRARMSKLGTAEAVYLNKEDALQACRKYHNRELDGQPMQVKMTSHSAASRSPAVVRKTPSPPPAPKADTPPPKQSRRPRSPSPKRAPSVKEESMETEFEPLRLGKDAPPSKLTNVDMGMIHKALFKVKGATPSKPVTFTVKI